MLTILFCIFVKQWDSQWENNYVVVYNRGRGFFVIFGMIVSTVEQRRDEEFIEETSKQLGKAAEWWYGKK